MVKFGGLNGRHFFDGEIVSKGRYLIAPQQQRTSDTQQRNYYQKFDQFPDAAIEKPNVREIYLRNPPRYIQQ